MTEQLALKFRPTRFEDVVGQRAATILLRAMVEQRRIPTALLFKGCRGTGKTTSARILAAAANCETDPGESGTGDRPCRECVACKAVFDGTSLGLVEIDAASNGLVDDIRALRQQVLYYGGCRCRVVVLDEAHSMSGPAFNALLKTLEEPPPGTVFILATTEPGRIPDTVLSRCMPFPFTRIAVADITERLSQICAAETIPAEPGLLHALAQRADGSMRDAVIALDQLHRAGITTLDGYLTLLGDCDHGPSLLARIADGDITGSYATLGEILHRTGDPNAVTTALEGTLRDLLILHSGGDLDHQGQALTDRQRLAGTLDLGAAFAGLNVLWDLRTKFRSSDDPRNGIELAIAILLDKLRPASSSGVLPVLHEAAASRKLSLTELAAIRR